MIVPKVVAVAALCILAGFVALGLWCAVLLRPRRGASVRQAPLRVAHAGRPGGFLRRRLFPARIPVRPARS